MSDMHQETLIKSQAASILDTVKKPHQICQGPYPKDIQAVYCQSLPSSQCRRNKITFHL